MSIEAPGKITGTPIIRREEDAALPQKRKPLQRKKEQKKEPERSGKIDIKI
jgi:hypothetical protein